MNNNQIPQSIIIEPMRFKNNLTAAVFCIAVLAIVAFSWNDHIIFTDEVLFEEASYQMYKTGDFIAPRLEGKVWLEKPPLYFWVTAAIYRVFPQTPFTRRIPTLLAAIGTLFLTFRLSQTLFSRKVAYLSLIILTTTPLFLFFTKTANLDIPQTFLTTATLFLYLKSKTNPKWLLLAGATTGLGILTRSFLALFPILVVTIDQLISKKDRLPISYLLSTFTIAIGIALPWHLVVWNKYPSSFANDYLKFNLQSHVFSQTPGYPPLSIPRFLFNTLVGVAPLNLLALALFLPNPKRSRQAVSLPAIWVLATIIPLSLAATRHEWYAIQALPPLAILSATGLVNLKYLLKHHVPEKRWDMVNIIAFTVLITLPTTVFINLKKEVKSVVLLKEFIANTPPGTPLYNLDYLYVPQSTLYNSRETPVIFEEELTTLSTPIYLYLDSREESTKAKATLNRCCHQQVFSSERGALILHLIPKANE